MSYDESRLDAWEGKSSLLLYVGMTFLVAIGLAGIVIVVALQGLRALFRIVPEQCIRFRDGIIAKR